MDDKVKALLERVRGTASFAADAAADGARAAVQCYKDERGL